jgi:hypothetical protein
MCRSKPHASSPSSLHYRAFFNFLIITAYIYLRQPQVWYHLLVNIFSILVKTDFVFDTAYLKGLFVQMWIRSVTEGPNIVGFLPSSTEDGNISSFWKVFSSSRTPANGQSPKAHNSECYTPSSETFRIYYSPAWLWLPFQSSGICAAGLIQLLHLMEQHPGPERSPTGVVLCL